MSKAKLVKKSEIDDIFAESQVGNYVVKPWTVAQFIKLSPILKYIANELQKQGIDISQADLQKISLDMVLSASDIIKYLTMGMDIVGPMIPHFIAVSVRIELEEAENIEWGPALALTAKIVLFNWDHIKNWYGQILGKEATTLFLAKTNNLS